VSTYPLFVSIEPRRDETRMMLSTSMVRPVRRARNRGIECGGDFRRAHRLLAVVRGPR
jgi:hypothetical protein